MNATSRTLVFVGVAAFSAVTALGVRYINQPASVEGFSDVGQEFFADFKDPLKAAELSVVKYDPETKEPVSFAVKQNDKGLWVIPSHQDYPAEASERLARTAASLIGIKKVALQSRSKEDWARYGVEDPSAEVAGSAEATSDEKASDPRGTRISLRDGSSNSLVDLIVGKPVEGREKHFYVRQPEKNPVFIAKLDADLSAKFSDWIEPDLLKLTQNDIVKIVADRYTIDEEQGAILKGELLEFSKDKTSNKWALSGLDALTEQLKESAITDVTRNLDNLKIVGVRPKPEGISSDLKVSADVARNPLLFQALQVDMQRQGFYVAPDESGDRKLYSNEGELIAGTSNGVKYTLYFGEIARGTAKDIETGLNEPKASVDGAKPEGSEAKSEEPKAEEKPTEPESGPRRYLLVKVEYDETLLGDKPVEPVAPEKPAILNEGAAPSAKVDEAKTPAEATPADAASSDAAAKSSDTPPAEAAKPEEAAKPDADAKSPTENTPEAANQKSDDAAPSCDEPTTAEPAAAEPTATETSQDTPAATPEASAESAAKESPAPAATSESAAPQDPQPAATDAPAAAPATATPVADEKPPAPPVDPKVEAQKSYDQALGDFNAAKAGYQDALKAWEQRGKDGKKKAEELATRFGAWYYVISADSFEQFKLARATVVEPKTDAKPADANAGGPPGSGLVPQFDLQGAGK